MRLHTSLQATICFCKTQWAKPNAGFVKLLKAGLDAQGFPYGGCRDGK
jgi:hypothetical protein